MEVVNLEVEEMEVEAQVSKKMKKEDGSAAVIRWERFLPTTSVLRVLLVEADDSTRQIISALLRKCSYRGWLDGYLQFSVFIFFLVLLMLGFGDGLGFLGIEV